MKYRIPEVLKVTPKTWKKDSGEEVETFWVTLDDRTEDVPCYDSSAKDLKTREPLPDGWEVRKSKAGKDYLATPKPKGGKGFEAAFRNTQAGQAYEQERMDRRTALMQAVEYAVPRQLETTAVLYRALLMYDWLRETSGAVVASAVPDVEEVGTPKGKGLPASSANVGGPRQHGKPGESPSAPVDTAGVLERQDAHGDTALASFSPPASSGANGDTAAPESGDDHASPDNPLIDQLYVKYGNGSKALIAARRFFEHEPPGALIDLTEGQMEMLLLEVAT